MSFGTRIRHTIFKHQPLLISVSQSVSQSISQVHLFQPLSADIRCLATIGGAAINIRNVCSTVISDVYYCLASLQFMWLAKIPRLKECIIPDGLLLLVYDHGQVGPEDGGMITER